jgi:hypothetical protein
MLHDNVLPERGIGIAHVRLLHREDWIGPVHGEGENGMAVGYRIFDGHERPDPELVQAIGEHYSSDLADAMQKAGACHERSAPSSGQCRNSSDRR